MQAKVALCGNSDTCLGTSLTIYCSISPLSMQESIVFKRAGSMCRQPSCCSNTKPRPRPCITFLVPSTSTPAFHTCGIRRSSSIVPAPHQHSSSPGPRLVASAASAAAAGDFADGHSSPLWGLETQSLAQKLREFVSAQYLPIALVSALTLGAVNPSLGLAASKMHIPALATFGIFMVQVRFTDVDVFL